MLIYSAIHLNSKQMNRIVDIVYGAKNENEFRSAL